MSKRKDARRAAAVQRQHDLIVASRENKHGYRYAPVEEFLPPGMTFCDGEHSADAARCC